MNFYLFWYSPYICILRVASETWLRLANDNHSSLGIHLPIWRDALYFWHSSPNVMFWTCIFNLLSKWLGTQYFLLSWLCMRHGSFEPLYEDRAMSLWCDADAWIIALSRHSKHGSVDPRNSLWFPALGLSQYLARDSSHWRSGSGIYETSRT